jgi:uncharacterized cupin superfamily protein
MGFGILRTMSKHIKNINEVEFKPFPGEMPASVKEKYEGATLAFVAPLIGAQKLGYNVVKLPPGKRAFPFHNHTVNEEMFFVLEGEGEARIGPDTFPLRQGDFLSCPPGGPELAHQIINTSKKDMRYLAVSTKLSPEIAEYPDTGKFGVLTEKFRFLGKADQSLGYWDGE